MPDVKHLLWFDLETTGTDEAEDRILEVGAILTTAAAPFDVLGDFLGVVAHDDMDSLVDGMNEVVVTMHTDNGLLDACRESTTDLEAVESKLVSLLQEHTKPHDVMLAGSGVSHFDRRFVRRQMPTLEKWVQYPHLDVGVVRRALWIAGRADLVPEAGDGDLKTHRGLDDARMHLAEWRTYAALIAEFVHHPPDTIHVPTTN